MLMGPNLTMSIGWGKTLFFLLALLLQYGWSQETICLNMIVKNERDVIEQCLLSVKPFVDYWVIIDTGSTDGTQTLIQEVMKGIPGKLYERPWVDFSYNRNEALHLAKRSADYILFIDADDFLTYDPNFTFPSLSKDCYYVTTHLDGFVYRKILLVSTKCHWLWLGLLHEYLYSFQAETEGFLEEIAMRCTRKGARSKDPEKYRKDAAVLEEALLIEPKNCRYVFYLAQSYRDAGDYEQALRNYEKRIEMNGWDEEVFLAMLEKALLQEKLGIDREIIIQSYERAYQFRSTRAETLFHLARFYLKIREPKLAYETAKKGIDLPLPCDLLWVSPAIYEYGLLYLCYVSASLSGYEEESKRAYERLLENPELPQNIREFLSKN